MDTQHLARKSQWPELLIINFIASLNDFIIFNSFTEEQFRCLSLSVIAHRQKHFLAFDIKWVKSCLLITVPLADHVLSHYVRFVLQLHLLQLMKHFPPDLQLIPTSLHSLIHLIVS